MIKKVCIIGGNGFLGTKYIELTNKKNLDIIVFDKKVIKKKSNIKYIYGDCLSKKTLKKIPNKIDILIYMVGQVGGPGSLNIDNLENYFVNNCQTLINFLENVKKKSIKKIIFFSTEHVYGDNYRNLDNHLKTEQQPKNFYGVTKLISEKILKNFYNKNKINIDVLRFPRIINQGDNSLLTNLISTVLKKKILKIDAVNTKFNFLYASDFIKAIDCCSTKINTGFRILNIFNCDKPLNLKQITEIIKKTFKIKFLVKYKKKSNKLTHNPNELVLSNKRLNKNKINWIPSLNNKDIIKKIYLHELKKYT